MVHSTPFLPKLLHRFLLAFLTRFDLKGRVSGLHMLQEQFQGSGAGHGE